VNGLNSTPRSSAIGESAPVRSCGRWQAAQPASVEHDAQALHDRRVVERGAVLVGAEEFDRLQRDIAELLSDLAREALEVGFAGLDASAGQNQLRRVAALPAQQQAIVPKIQETYLVNVCHERLELHRDQRSMTKSQ